MAKDQTDPKRKAISIHEAAHAVVGHEVGGTVLWINVDGDPKKGRLARINWPFDPYQIRHLARGDAAAVAKAEARAKALAACFVAGEVAEFAGTDKPLVSARIPDNFWFESDEPLERSDRGMVTWALTSARIFDPAVVLAAEKRARDILADRKARHDFLVQKLLETGYVEPPVLTEGLSK
jgi:hypothetical protein